jgi:hypothetical protein
MEYKNISILDIYSIDSNYCLSNNNILNDLSYILDEEISIMTEKVYYNNKTEHVIILIAGFDKIHTEYITNFIEDKNIHIIEQTEYIWKRIYQTKKFSKKLKEKYPSQKYIFIGHSFGGLLAGEIASSTDLVYTFNKLCVKSQPNTTNYRTTLDTPSILEVILEKNNTNTLPIDKSNILKYIISNIRDKNLWIKLIEDSHYIKQFKNIKIKIPV